MKRARLLLALVSGAPGSWAQSGAPTPTPVFVWRTPRIKIAMSRERALNGSNINVDTNSSAKTITLTGTVGSAAQKTLAGKIAREKAEGFSVQNRLVVRRDSRVVAGQAASPTQRKSFALLTPRIKTALVGTREMIGANINIESDLLAHTVTLSGTVRSSLQKKRAGDIARQNAQGFEVRNQLIVRTDGHVVPTQAISPTQKVAGVPVRFQRTVQFLQLLARSQGRGQSETFGERKVAFPASDLKRLMSLVSARGVTIVDVNENNGRPLALSRAILQRDLKRTGSSAFDSFAYVGYIFNLNYSQYSQLTCTPTQSGVVVEMPSGHRFTWVRENKILRLRKLEYLSVEGD